jgi:plastocyanin
MMRKFLPLLLFFSGIISFASAANFNITINGLAYEPDDLTVNVGDVVTIQASGFHPLVQVSAATWSANGATALPGGFTSNVNFVLNITAAMAGTNIYYVCSNHVASSSMKGRINVNVVASIDENRLRDFNFTVYPNPANSNSYLNISTKNGGKISLTLYDLQGRVVKQVIDMNLKPGELTMGFDAGRLQRGNYVLLMRAPEGTLRKQVLIQ